MYQGAAQGSEGRDGQAPERAARAWAPVAKTPQRHRTDGGVGQPRRQEGPEAIPTTSETASASARDLTARSLQHRAGPRHPGRLLPFLAPMGPLLAPTTNTQSHSWPRENTLSPSTGASTAVQATCSAQLPPQGLRERFSAQKVAGHGGQEERPHEAVRS